MKRVPFPTLVFLLTSLPTLAQDTATIVGTVTDPSGGVIVGAKVTVSNPEKGFTRELESNRVGEYVADKVPIGNYLITAEFRGFLKLVRAGITVSGGETLRVDLQLEELDLENLREKTPADPWGVFRATGCSEYYRAMKEPSLGELLKIPKAQAYRFVWLRSFHHPIAVRLNIRDEGTSLLTVKEISGADATEPGPGHFILNQSRVISKDQTQWFLERIEALKYWDIPYEEIQLGRPPGCDHCIALDGAEWIMEGVRNGKYKVITRWAPDDGPIRTLGLIMVVDLAKMRIRHGEIY